MSKLAFGKAGDMGGELLQRDQDLAIDQPPAQQGNQQGADQQGESA